MVKTPRTRHSKTTKEPVTIDLQPGEISRVKAEAEAAGKKPAAGATAAETPEKPATSASLEPETEPTGFGGAETGREPEPEKPAPEAKPAGDAESGKPAASTEDAKRSTSSSQAGDTAFGRREPQPAAAPGRGNALAAGAAGGVLALLIAGGLQFAGLLPGTQTPQELESRTVAELRTQIGELRDQISALNASSAENTELASRVSGTEERVTALVSDLDALRGELGELRGTAAEGGQPVDIGPIEERMAAIETALAAAGNTENPEEALSAVNGQIDTLRQDLAGMREQQAAATSRLDAVEQSISDLTGRVEENAEAPGTAVIIAASALKAAIDRGAPFMTELETFASLAPEAPEIAELRDLAAAGVPTRADIEAGSDDAANAMISASRPVDPQAGVIDRLWSSATGLVQVRPVGMVEGEGVPERVARLDAAVTAGDYERAIAEFDALPEASRTAGEPFMAKVRARQAADRLIDQALTAALGT